MAEALGHAPPDPLPALFPSPQGVHGTDLSWLGIHTARPWGLSKAPSAPPTATVSGRTPVPEDQQVRRGVWRRGRPGESCGALTRLRGPRAVWGRVLGVHGSPVQGASPSPFRRRLTFRLRQRKQQPWRRLSVFRCHGLGRLHT